MGIVVVEGAQCLCSMGTGPSALKVTSQLATQVGGKAIATMKDTASSMNVLPFGMCNSILNPNVASATAAALGVLTPQPCTPTTSSFWCVTQSKICIQGVPCLSNDSKLLCMYGGCISILDPGQIKCIV